MLDPAHLLYRAVRRYIAFLRRSTVETYRHLIQGLKDHDSVILAVVDSNIMDLLTTIVGGYNHEVRQAYDLWTANCALREIYYCRMRDCRRKKRTKE
jgi:hypothetical protein